MMRLRSKLALGLCLPLLVGLGLAGGAGCSDDHPGASARIITYRNELIGGDRALGEIGDFIIENEKVRFIIQKAGPSRAFGVFGGSLIDADLRRPVEKVDGQEGAGYDQFAELFPSLFLQASATDEVKVLSSGADGGPARLEASGNGGDFFEMLAVFNRVITGSHASFLTSLSAPQLRYSMIYELEPGKQYLTLRFKVTNTSSVPLPFPGKDKDILETAGLDTTGFTVPTGDVALFGATSRMFIPGGVVKPSGDVVPVGFDLRGGLDAAYDAGADWPAFPGILADFVASKGEHTSYGLVAAPSSSNFVMSHAAQYDGKGPLTDHTMLVPFSTSGAIGVFYDNAPPELASGASFEAVRYFVVGSGDVGSVTNVINEEIRGTPVGELSAMIVEEGTGAPAEGASVVVYTRDASGVRLPYSQFDVKAGGYVHGTLPPGSYSLRIVGEGRVETAPLDFDVAAHQETALRAEAHRPAKIFVHVHDAAGLPMPAKVTAVGAYAADRAGQDPRTFLYDLPAGDEWRAADLVEDDPANPQTRRYIEAIAFGDRGVAELSVRPGTYDVVTSRGPEYALTTTRVTVTADASATIATELDHVVDTRGWISIDPHVHSRESTDSALTLDERVRSLAGEGVEVPVATDHNMVTDYGPYVARNDLTEWLHPIIGVELTTLESGHFNGYPLDYDAGHSTHGSFEWAHLPPDEIFTRLRKLGRYGADHTIVQVNHPRDQVLGYYGQYDRSGLTHQELPATGFSTFLKPKGPAFLTGAGTTAFSFQYDAMELANGKLYWEVHHFRVPDPLPPGDLPDVVPPTGTILVDAEGEPAFPGVVDDWFNLLNLGYRFVGVGSGDSHAASDEAGQFRTLAYVGDDRPAGMSDRGIVDALQRRRVLVTNGPMLDFYVDDPVKGAMGSTLTDGDGTVSLTLSLSSAAWVGVERVNVYRNGVIAQSIDLEKGRDLVKNPLVQTLELPMDADPSGAAKDSWFVVEAIGYDNMFPVIRPVEQPPLQLIDAVAALAGPLGLGQDEFGALRPAETFPVTAYAITNPVWVTLADGPFHAPGLVPAAVQMSAANDPKWQVGIYTTSPAQRERRKVKRQANVSEHYDRYRGYTPLFDPAQGNIFDIRNAFLRYGGPHGHE